MQWSRNTIRNALDEGENSRMWVPGQSILKKPAQQMSALKIIALYLWWTGNNKQFIAYNLTQMTCENILNSSAECPRMLGSPMGNSELALIDLTNPHQLAACWTISLKDFIFSHLRRLQKTHQTPKGTDPSRYSAPRVPSYCFLETKTFSLDCITLGKMKRDLEKYQFLAPPPKLWGCYHGRIKISFSELHSGKWYPSAGMLSRHDCWGQAWYQAEEEFEFCEGSAGRKEVGSGGIHILSAISSGPLPQCLGPSVMHIWAWNSL